MDDHNKLPVIDYLSKDYASFRQLILDHIAIHAPDWIEDHPADMGNVIVDLLAYVADYLSYYQDGVATEAYLGTARLRRSIQRHVRMLDYDWHEGCNARVWVQVRLKALGMDAGVPLPKGTPLLTSLGTGTAPVLIDSEADYAEALLKNPIVFETMHNAMLYEAHNRISFYTEEGSRSLRRGATSARLRNDMQPLNLKAGDVLIIESDSQDPPFSQPVRLTQVTSSEGADGTPLLEIQWHSADALAIPLLLVTLSDDDQPIDVTVALGNIVLADHGYTINNEVLPPVPAMGRYYPMLHHTGVTFCVPYDETSGLGQPAKTTLEQNPSQALTAVSVLELGSQPIRLAAKDPIVLIPTIEGQHGQVYPVKQWQPRLELMSSGTFVRDYVVEVEENGQAYLRFGYAGVGWQPAVVGARCIATYRVGNGPSGNIGPRAIKHIAILSDNVITEKARIGGVSNPLSAQGGISAVDAEKARLNAPEAVYSEQDRCVTEGDYQRMAERHYDVAHASVQIRSTGGWHTVIIYIQRHFDRSVRTDPRFQQELRDLIEPYRMAGHRIEIREARFVPLVLEMTVYLRNGYRRIDVNTAIHKAFFYKSDSQTVANGFFFPENFAFGQTVYRSQVINQVMQVPGVVRVDVTVFRRLDSNINAEPISFETIPVGPLEILRLDPLPTTTAQGVFRITIPDQPVPSPTFASQP